jgi:hypothetical protein
MCACARYVFFFFITIVIQSATCKREYERAAATCVVQTSSGAISAILAVRGQRMGLSLEVRVEGGPLSKKKFFKITLFSIVQRVDVKRQIFFKKKYKRQFSILVLEAS